LEEEEGKEQAQLNQQEGRATGMHQKLRSLQLRSCQAQQLVRALIT